MIQKTLNVIVFHIDNVLLLVVLIKVPKKNSSLLLKNKLHDAERVFAQFWLNF